MRGMWVSGCRHVACVSLAFALALPPPVTSAQVPGPIVGGLTLGVLIGQLEDALNKAIEQAGKEARQTVMVAGQQARLLLETFKANSRELLDVAFDKLTQAQQKAFTDVRFVIAEFSSSLDASAEKMLDVSKRLEFAIANLPLSPDTPRLLRYSPVYYAGTSVGDKVSLSIDGSFLALGDTTVTLDGTTLRPEQKTDTRLTFLVPGRLLSTTDTIVAYKTLQLTVHRKVKKWLFFDRLEAQNYSLLVYSLPRRLGTYAVTLVRTVMTTKRENRRTPTIETYSGDCDGRRDCHQVNATPGWLIDTSTPSWAGEHSDGGRFEGWKNLSAAGFCVDLFAEPHGHAKVLGQCIKGTIGHISGKVHYTEFKQDVPEDVGEPFGVGDGSLHWGQDRQHQLPIDTKGVTVSLRLFDGRESSYNGSAVGDVLVVEFNSATKTLLLKPKSPDQALRR